MSNNHKVISLSQNEDSKTEVLRRGLCCLYSTEDKFHRQVEQYGTQGAALFYTYGCQHFSRGASVCVSEKCDKLRGDAFKGILDVEPGDKNILLLVFGIIYK